MKIVYPARAKVVHGPTAPTLSSDHLAAAEADAEPAPGAGVPRAELTVPVCPTATEAALTDTAVLEGAAEPDRRWYVPRYRIAEQAMVGGERHLRIALAKAGAAWALTVHLDAYPPPELGEAAASWTPLAGAYPVVLRYQVALRDGGAVTKERELSEVVETATGLVATARIESAIDQAELYAALAAGEASAATLIVKRAPRVGVPFDLAASRDERIARTMLGWYAIELDEARRRLAAREGQPLMRLILQARLKGDERYKAVLERQLAEIVERQLAAGTANRFHVVALNLPQPIPLRLDKAIHAYVFAGVEYRAVGASGVVRRRLGGASYFQDEAQPRRFYYLPDRYELATSGGYPRMSIQQTTRPGRYLLDYAAVPVIDDARLRRDGGALLRAYCPECPSDGEGPELEPLSADRPELSVRLPQPDPGGEAWAYVVRDKAIVDLQDEVRDILPLDVVGLRALFDAVFGGSQALFTGHVNVPIGPEPDRIPFVGRVEGLTRQQVWQHVYAREVPRDAARTVRVKVAPAVFAQARPPIAKVAVDFEPSGAVELTPDRLTADASVPCDLEAYMLDQPDAGTYAYRVTLHLADSTTIDRGRHTAVASLLRPELGEA